MKTKKQSRSRVAIDESNLCQFPFADDRQCRMSRHASHDSLCLFHTRQEQQLGHLDRGDVELASLAGEFRTASDVNNAIRKLFELIAANRVPARTARLLAYMSQLLLYSQKQLRQEQKVARTQERTEEMLRELHAGGRQARATQPLNSESLSSRQEVRTR